jgi:hypothetical protein
MADESISVKTFLAERVAPRFGETVRDAERRLEALQREVDDLRSARGTIAWEVESLGTWYLNIENGQMSAGDTPLEDPFMAAAQSAADWQRLASGALGTGFLTGGGRRGLGKSRIDRIRPIRGALRFVLTGLPDGDWSVTVYYGPGPRPAEPQTTVRVPADVAQKLQSGELNPQVAFMQGQVRLEGDAALAMQVGMATML